jgi:hypothetical protein
MPTIYPPSKLEAILRGASSIAIGLGSVWALLQLPDGSNIGNALGDYLALIWGAMMLCSLPAGIMTARGQYRGEYIMLPLFTAAIFIADMHLWAQATLYGHSDLTGRAFFLLALVLIYLARFFTLRRLIRIGLHMGEHRRRRRGMN